MKARYDKIPIPKKKRHQASRVLVKGLTSKHDIIRKTSIDCLQALYDATLLYRYNASPGDRKERSQRWKRFIDKKRK